MFHKHPRYWGSEHPDPMHGPLTNIIETNERAEHARARAKFINPARVTPTGPFHVTGVQPEEK